MSVVTQNMTGDDTHACLTMCRTAIRDVIPCERRALAQQAPVLFWPIVDVHNPGFDTTGARSPVRATLDIGVREPRRT